MVAYGKRTWFIPDMYWPEVTSEGHYVSHEAICVLNTGDEAASVLITAYFEDREPVSFPVVDCPARRTNHIRMDRLNKSQGIAPGTCSAAVISSDIPVIVQYTRIDTTQQANAIMTAIPYGIS